MVDLTVLTVSMPDRAKLLDEACASLKAQTVKPVAHLLRVEPPVGEPNPNQLAVELNHLLPFVTTEWLAILEDDDVWYPQHLESLPLEADADVAYTWGDGAGAMNLNDWDQGRVATYLTQANPIPYCAAVRTELIREQGGYGGEFDAERRIFTATGAWAQDWDMWIRLARDGARFRCNPTVTWAYRQGPQSITRTWWERRS